MQNDSTLNHAGIYIHWPFCLNKCPYCNFNSVVDNDFESYNLTHAYIKELKARKHQISDCKLVSIYFGGGTPSLMNSDEIAVIIADISRDFELDNIEVTLEVNPATVDLDKLKKFKESGINRLSIGVQSFDEKVLKNLGRIHNSRQAKQVIEDAKQAGFENISLDFIFGTKYSSLENLKSDLDLAIKFNPQHISAYLLTIEEDTPFGRRQSGGKILTASEELCRKQLIFCSEYLAQNGYEQYEISNYSKANFQSRHNGLYWSGNPYLAIGPGACGYVPPTHENAGYRYENTRNVTEYLASINAGKETFDFSETLNRENVCREAIMTGLRRLTGISKSEFKQRTGFDLVQKYGDIISKLIDSNMLKWSVFDKNEHLCLTKEGLLYSDSVFLHFF